MLQVAIIGGGLVGSNVAYRLLRRGAQVTVFDAAAVGQATAAAAGILPPLDHFIGIEAVLPLLREARRYYPELIAALAEDGEADSGYEIVGALQVATNESECERLSELTREAALRRDAGYPHIGALTELDGDEARSHFPLLGPGVLRALHAADAARVDARRLLAALHRAIAKRGGRWERGYAEPILSGGRVAGVRLGHKTFAADVVVIAAGAWSSTVADQLGLRVSVRPQRGQLVHLDLPGTDTARWPTVLGFSIHYLLCFGPHRVVAGATREDAAGYEAHVTAGGVHGVLEGALRLAPGLARAVLHEVRVGFRPVSADGKPVLGASPRYPNLYVATGHGGYGLEVGPYSGALVADLIVGAPLGVDSSPFAVGRFEEAPAPRSR
jgi:D-amino-acid dehydrogenase